MLTVFVITKRESMCKLKRVKVKTSMFLVKSREEC